MTKLLNTEIRKRHRRARQELPPTQQRVNARLMTRRLAIQRFFLAATHIAFYKANDGEIDPQWALEKARHLGKSCYLPCLPTGIHRKGGLHFQPWRPELILNRYGIPEPPDIPGSRYTCRMLDLILLPMVAFDREGARLGMGKGYYDRSLAFILEHHCWRRPLVIGLAHSFQESSELTRQPWDVPLDGVITEKETILFRHRWR